METNAARTTVIRLINNSRVNYRLSKVTLGDGAAFRGEAPRVGSGLPTMSQLFWEIEWSGPAEQVKPTELEFSGEGTVVVSMTEREGANVRGAQAQIEPSRQREGYEITLR